MEYFSRLSIQLFFLLALHAILNLPTLNVPLGGGGNECNEMILPESPEVLFYPLPPPME